MQLYSFLIVIITLFLNIYPAFSQFKNTEDPLSSEQIKASSVGNIKVVRIVHSTESSIPKYLNTYDRWGRIIEQVKYHIIPELTIKEKYVYNNSGNISEKLRFNSAGGLILHIRYKYAKNGALRSERYTTYANTVYRSMHYMIDADISYDSVFTKLQRIAGIDPPLHTYTLTVNINDEDEFNRYVVIGDENDPSSQRIPWSEIPPDMQSAIINYNNSEKKTIIDRVVFIDRITYKSDEKGKVISKRVRATSGSTLSSESYSYDEKGWLKTVSIFSSAGTLKSSSSFNYDTTGNLTELISASGKIINKYDSTSRMKEKFIYNSFGELSASEVYNYDDYGKMIEIIQSNTEGAVLSRRTFTYDERNNPVSFTIYNSEGEPVETINYIYTYQ
jgi:hypothetical protein